MFANFIYFIVVLLIYSTYQPPEPPNLDPVETLALFFGLIAGFALLTRQQFRRIQRRIDRERFARLEHRLNATLTRQSVIAIGVFAVDIYGLNLTAYFVDAPLFSLVPTLQALVFLALFIVYLVIVWYCAYEPYRRLYGAPLSRREYINSNISMSVPVLLPWLVLSGVSDLIYLLPFSGPKRFLGTTQGQIVYFLFFLFVIAIFGPEIIRRFWQCKPLDIPELRDRIARLCRRAELEYADVLYWPIFGGRMITAGVMGLVRHFRYILVTRGLLDFLDPPEIDAVIAHEIGHIKKKHLLFYLFFFAGYMMLSYASFDLIVLGLIYVDPLYRLTNAIGIHQSTVISAVFSLVLISLFLIYFRYIFGYFMRNFERQADIYVYSLFDTAQPLISTFEKITLTSGQSPDTPNWHHFSISQRIEYLRKCEQDRRWIDWHNQKIRWSIFAYLLGILIVGWGGYHLNFGEFGDQLGHRLLEKALLHEIKANPQDPKLHGMLGDMYHNAENYSQAIAAYRKSLEFDPQSARILNNLAWLYATCPKQQYRDPQQALALAKKAVQLDDSPYVLDTLAESYYLNGQYQQAIETGKKALDKAQKKPFNRTGHYREQLEKFRKARQGDRD